MNKELLIGLIVLSSWFIAILLNEIPKKQNSKRREKSGAWKEI